jgi:predicted DNA-binding transcriptional regulator YafY
MPNPATRLITLIMLLQRKPNQKAHELAEQLGVSVRTVQRYISMLDDMGIPVYAERGPYGGYALVRGYKMPPLVLTPAEAVAVYLGTGLVEKMWGQLYWEAAQGALAKLDNLLPDEQLNEVAWARRTLLATNMHRADHKELAPVLDKLRRAARERRRLGMVYRGRSQVAPIQRDLDPYALVHRWGWWYIVGYCHLREDIRSFRVDRIAELTLLDETFAVRDDFDIQTYLDSEPHTRHGIHVRLRFAPEAALMALDDSAMWHTLDEQPDGSVIVTLATPSLGAAACIVMGYAPHSVVLEPEELRHKVCELALATAAQYKSV